jgi:hypothetical protein
VKPTKRHGPSQAQLLISYGPSEPVCCFELFSTKKMLFLNFLFFYEFTKYTSYKFVKNIYIYINNNPVSHRVACVFSVTVVTPPGRQVSSYSASPLRA